MRRLGHRGLPNPIVVSPGSVDESYSARLLAIQGILDIEEINDVITVAVRDGSGTLPVYISPAYYADPRRVERLLASKGREVRVRGILVQDTEPDAPTDGYYLIARTPADIMLPVIPPTRELLAVVAGLLLIALITNLARRRVRAEREAAELLAAAVRLQESEARLQESERRYRGLFENVAIGLFQIAPNGRMLSANGVLARILGYPEVGPLIEVGLDRHYLDPDDRVRFVEGLAATELVTGFEAWWERCDGAEILVSMDARAVRAPDGSIQYFESTVEDLTERRASEQRLREAESRVGQLVGMSPTIIYAVSLHEHAIRCTWMSESVTRILGYSVEDAADYSWWTDRFHPEDRERAISRCVTFLEEQPEGSELSHEYRFRHRDGSYRWFRNDLRIIARGDSVEAVGALLDFTSQKETTIALTLAEAKYRRLVETSPDGIFAVDADGRLNEINPKVGAIFGMRPGEMLGRSARDLIAPESRSAVRAELEKVVVDPGVGSDYEAWILRPTGERRLVHVRSIPVVREGRVEGAHGVIRDITEDRRRDNRLQLLGAAVESLGHGVAVSDAAGDIIYANSGFATLFGFDADATPTPSSDEFLPDEAARRQVEEIRAALLEEGRWSGRIWRRRFSDGEVIPIEAVIGNVPSPHGGTPHALTICHDATEAIRRDKHLRRAERLSSLGTLVGGVAHELNNPLNAIINFAALLLTQNGDAEQREDLQTIVREGERAARIVSNLRVIARQAEIEQSPREAVDINDVLEHVLKIRGYSLTTSNIAVKASFGRSLPRIRADRGQMEQVVLNLIINAEQAMAAAHGEGLLRVVSKRSPLGVRVEVADDGPGIESSNIERIFDPFWTTKAPGEGMGLGLSLVHNIVQEHGGVVDLRTEVGVGTTFFVDMPEIEAVADLAPPEVPEAPPTRAIRVLVVDDEAAVRQSIVRYLTREGHHVDEAAEGGEALEKHTAGVGFDVILSDLRMPGINGHQLLARLRQRGMGEDRRVVLMTGDATSAEAAAVDRSIPLLIKPIRLAEVGEAIRRVATPAGGGDEQATLVA